MWVWNKSVSLESGETRGLSAGRHQLGLNKDREDTQRRILAEQYGPEYLMIRVFKLARV